MKIFIKIALAAGVSLSSFAAVAAFVPNMTAAQVDAEVQRSLIAGQSLSVIAAGAKSAGVSEALLVSAMLGQGLSVQPVICAVVEVGDPKSVVSAAIAAGVAPAVVTQAALACGVDPQIVTASTAAGGPQGGDTVGGPSGLGNFGNSPVPTFTGGGGGSVSRS
ncbi:hypothetical protein [uncultured Azonexus sp.]|uniref:hypothetical protein n=1 Tax=uncultured Azonexus sp. TaxID=520307 RepID=UPI0026375FB5|nr:hypothetical protein [uncultured Azonexus sp.]